MKMSKGLGLLLAAAAAYGLYKYNKMDAQEKDALKEKIKDQGKKIYEEYVPQDVKNVFSKVNDAVNEESPAY